MLGLTAMEEQTDLPLPTELVVTPFTAVAGKTEHAAAPEPFTLTPPPIPWEELDRRHHAATTA
jgi:hypothetical protein